MMSEFLSFLIAHRDEIEDDRQYDMAVVGVYPTGAAEVEDYYVPLLCTLNSMIREWSEHERNPHIKDRHNKETTDAKVQGND